jgi:hypothetical protein
MASSAPDSRHFIFCLRLGWRPLSFNHLSLSGPYRYGLCELILVTTNQAAIISLFRVINSYIGNLSPDAGRIPYYPAPVVRNLGAERELTIMRWGMPPPPKFGGAPVTNIRNTWSALARLVEAEKPLPCAG